MAELRFRKKEGNSAGFVRWCVMLLRGKMESAWVVLRLKQALVMVCLSCVWVCSAALGTRGMSWFPQLLPSPGVSGASCSAVAP